MPVSSTSGLWNFYDEVSTVQYSTVQ